MRGRLESISIRGFKTIRELDSFQPGPLTVLIGPNGVGKSNFISFFSMLNKMLIDPFFFQAYVAQQGGASRLLLDGPAVTHKIEAHLKIHNGSGVSEYEFLLDFAASDTLIFSEERYHGVGGEAVPWHSLGTGHHAPQLLSQLPEDYRVSDILDLLQKIIVYQFHNTSATANIRTKWDAIDNFSLREDGANIAPFLLNLKRKDRRRYQRIVDHIRLFLPFFLDFELIPENGRLILAWRESNSEVIFDVSQASDGMLRAIALVTLLLQPEEMLPDILFLDEPELGLHPAAIDVIGGLIRAVSQKVQVIVATQSTAFVDRFELSDIVVVERKGRESVFRRQVSSEALDEWLKEYSLSELWEKNVIGGRP